MWRWVWVGEGNIWMLSCRDGNVADEAHIVTRGVGRGVVMARGSVQDDGGVVLGRRGSV